MLRLLSSLILLPTIAFGQAMPSDLAEYGSRTENSIRIAVFGYAVARAGYYHMPRGASVQDAAASAKIRQNGWDPAYSYIQRRKRDGSAEMIRFTGLPLASAEKIALQDGDILRLSHEVY